MPAYRHDIIEDFSLVLSSGTKSMPAYKSVNFVTRKYVSFMLTGTTFAVSRFHLNGTIHLQQST